MKGRLPWWPWLTVFVVWSLLLVTPGNWFPGETASAKFAGNISAGKLLHVGAYALLAASAGWLPIPWSSRLALAFILVLHGGLTELIQVAVPYREGCLRDVGIDAFGVLLGLAISWRSWPRAVAAGAKAK